MKTLVSSFLLLKEIHLYILITQMALMIYSVQNSTIAIDDLLQYR